MGAEFCIVDVVSVVGAALYTKLLLYWLVDSLLPTPEGVWATVAAAAAN